MPCLGGTRQKLLCWLLIMEKIWLVYVSNFSYTNLLVFRCNIILDGETPCREAIGGCLQDVLLLNWGPFSFFFVSFLLSDWYDSICCLWFAGTSISIDRWRAWFYGHIKITWKGFSIRHPPCNSLLSKFIVMFWMRFPLNCIRLVVVMNVIWTWLVKSCIFGSHFN